MGLDEQWRDGENARELFGREDGLPVERAYEWGERPSGPGLKLRHTDITAEENTYHASTAAAEAWREANRMLDRGESLSGAALLLETFLQKASDQDYAALEVSVRVTARLTG